MDIDLKGFTVLITGGSSGIGFEMAKALLSRGASVVIGARAGARLDRALAALRPLGDAHAVPVDVRSEASVDAAAERFSARFDRLDMLVCDAGVGNNTPGLEELPVEHRFYDIPASAVRTILDTNLLGFFLTARRFVPMMVSRGRGSLVYVSTSDRTITGKGQLPYGPSKAGAEAMAAIMAEELRGSGIAVNVICPGGFTDTSMAPAGAKERFLQSGLPILPPTVLNEVILFLASPAAAGLTGEKIIGKEFRQWLADRGLPSPFDAPGAGEARP